MKVKIDLSKDGLAMFFKPYEVLAWHVLWNTPMPIGSGDVWARVSKVMGHDTISRTSIIFFLNRQCDLGFMDWNDATGKGGHCRMYYPKVSMVTLAQTILDDATTHLGALIYKAYNEVGGIGLLFDGDNLD